MAKITIEVNNLSPKQFCALSFLVERMFGDIIKMAYKFEQEADTVLPEELSNGFKTEDVFKCVTRTFEYDASTMVPIEKVSE